MENFIDNFELNFPPEKILLTVPGSRARTPGVELSRWALSIALFIPDPRLLYFFLIDLFYMIFLSRFRSWPNTSKWRLWWWTLFQVCLHLTLYNVIVSNLPPNLPHNMVFVNGLSHNRVFVNGLPPFILTILFFNKKKHII